MNIRIVLMSFIILIFSLSTYGVFKKESKNRNALREEQQKTANELGILFETQAFIKKIAISDFVQFRDQKLIFKKFNENKIRDHFPFLSLKLDEWIYLLEKANLADRLNNEGLDDLKKKINYIQELARTNHFKNFLLLTDDYKKNEMAISGLGFQDQKKIILKFVFDGQENFMLNSPIKNAKLKEIQNLLINMADKVNGLPHRENLINSNKMINDVVNHEINNKKQESLNIIKKFKNTSVSAPIYLLIALGAMCVVMVLVFYPAKKKKQEKVSLISSISKDAVSFFEYLSSIHEKPLFVMNNSGEIAWSNNAFLEGNLEKLIYEGETLSGRAVKEELINLNNERLQIKTQGTFDVVKINAPSSYGDYKIYVLDPHSGNIFSSLEKALAKLSMITQKNGVEVFFDDTLLNMSETFVDNKESMLTPFVGQALRYLIEEKNKINTTTRKIKILSFLDKKNNELEICIETNFCKISAREFKKYISCLSFAKDIHCKLKFCNLIDKNGELVSSKVMLYFPLNKFNKYFASDSRMAL